MTSKANRRESGEMWIRQIQELQAELAKAVEEIRRLNLCNAEQRDWIETAEAEIKALRKGNQ